MRYNRINDKELAMLIVEYVDRLEALMSDISTFIYDRQRAKSKDEIQYTYRTIKNEIREIADYVSKNANSDGSSIYIYYFCPSIKEAAAWGFTVPVNARVDQAMHSAVEEAHYKLTKYYSRNKWVKLAE